MFPKPRIANHYKNLNSGSGARISEKFKLMSKDHFQYFIAGLFGLIEDLVIVFSLGMIYWDLRAYSLFELFEDHT